jgi:hypothetical protein
MSQGVTHSEPLAALPPADRTRLANLLGMLGSEHDGEIINAARAATRLVRDRGLTWHQVLAPKSSPQARLPPREPRKSRPAPAGPTLADLLADWPDTWHEVVTHCRSAAPAGVLGRWDADFLRVLAGYKNRPSPKQCDALFNLAQKVAAGATR